ncbi:RagB/SusD family nutrient uptake outer membrane protein [Sinomicrobium sp. M5D2P9]
MKSIRKIKAILTIVIMGIILWSCNSDFLEESPTESISNDDAVSTTKNLFAIINGIHRSLYIRYDESQGRIGVGAMMIQNDVLGDDFVMTSRGNGWFVSAAAWNMHTNASSADNRYPYKIYYRIIRNANEVIIGTETAEGPDEEKNMVKGQALTYRAWAHFQLVQLYGKRYDASGENTQPGVPIRLIPENEPLPRASVEQVYTQVNKDLDEAIVLLDGYERGNKSHFDKSVVLGLKARVALVQQNYSIAAEYAALAREGYSLMSNDEYYGQFNTYTNGEWMWGSYVQEDQSDTFGNFGAYVSRNFSSTNIRTNPKAINSLLYDEISSTDIRSKLFDPTGEHDSLPPGYSIASNFAKFPYTNQKFLAAGTGDSRMDVPYMRAAEMYLIEAEALSYIDENASRNILYELASNRDSEYVLSTNSGQDLKEEIYLQRRIELWGEGFRFYDLKRLNLPLDRTGANHVGSVINNIYTVPAGDNRWQWLIPLDAINANPLLEQNPI